MGRLGSLGLVSDINGNYVLPTDPTAVPVSAYDSNTTIIAALVLNGTITQAQGSAIVASNAAHGPGGPASLEGLGITLQQISDAYDFLNANRMEVTDWEPTATAIAADQAEIAAYQVHDIGPVPGISTLTTPVTPVTSAAATVTPAVSTDWFTQNTIWSAVPNWAVLAGVGVGAMMLMGGKKGR